jgi:NADH-quinone oxidoreductase subunit N
MSMAFFSSIMLSGYKNNIKYLINWTALSERNFCFALTLSLILFSMAGIPPLAGFYSKLCVFFSLLAKHYFISAVILAIFSSVSCFYYIKLIKIFFFSSNARNNIWVGQGTKNIEFFVSFLTFIIVLFLSMPNILVDTAHLAAIFLL